MCSWLAGVVDAADTTSSLQAWLPTKIRGRWACAFVNQHEFVVVRRCVVVKWRKTSIGHRGQHLVPPFTALYTMASMLL